MEEWWPVWKHLQDDDFPLLWGVTDSCCWFLEGWTGEHFCSKGNSLVWKYNWKLLTFYLRKPPLLFKRNKFSSETNHDVFCLEKTQRLPVTCPGKKMCCRGPFVAGFAQGVSGVTWTAVGRSGKLGTWDDCMIRMTIQNLPSQIMTQPINLSTYGNS